jgi:hypothetical protein
MKDLEESLALSGLEGTPFAAATKSKASRESKFATSQVASTIIQNLLAQIPNYVASLTQTGISGLAEARTTKSYALSSSESYSKSKGGGGESAGGGCIVCTAIDGIPHPAIRLYRDDRLSDRALRGYYRLADATIPYLTRACPRFLARILFVRPLTSYAKSFYGYGRPGLLFFPLAFLWRSVLHIAGRRAPYKRRHTGEVY